MNSMQPTFIVGVVLAVALAGCGSGSNSSPDPQIGGAGGLPLPGGVVTRG